MTDSMSGSNRRRWLRKAIPAGIAVLLAAGVTAGPALAATAAASPAGLTTSLVAPTGHYRAGTVRLHLVDPARIDPTSPSHGIREIMVQVWYPAAGTRGFPTAPYLTPLAAAHFLASKQPAARHRAAADHRARRRAGGSPARPVPGRALLPRRGRPTAASTPGWWKTWSATATSWSRWTTRTSPRRWSSRVAG